MGRACLASRLDRRFWPKELTSRGESDILIAGELGRVAGQTLYGNVGGRQWDFADEVREMMTYRYAKIELKGEFYPESFARMAEQRRWDHLAAL